MADHTSGIGAGIGPIDNGGLNRTPERQPLRIGLGRLIIIVTQGTAISSGTAMQFIDVILGQQSASTDKAKVAGIIGVAFGAGQFAAEIDAPQIVVNGLMIGEILAVTYDTVTTTVSATN